jgi:hypothetical protein
MVRHKKIMKTKTFFLTALLAAGPVLAMRGAAEQPERNPRIQVVFSQPEKFTDVKQTYNGDEREREDLLTQVRDYLYKEARLYVPEGDRLEITFTDIDMAGDFEPWRGPNWQDVRIVKDIYPPRIELSFRLLDANGNVIKEGTRKLTDLSFAMKLNPNLDRSDPLRHEKLLLDDWIRQEMPAASKS